MACIIKISTTSYNPDTQKMESQETVLPGTIEENETISMDKVAEMISTLPQEQRAQLAALLVKAKSQGITKKMVGEHQFVGNTTVGELLDAYPGLKEAYKVDPKLYERYTIIRAKEFTINNIGYNGRVLDSQGKEMFIIKDYAGAAKFVKYLQAREMVERSFDNAGNSLSESITPEMMEDLKLMAKAKNISNPKDLILSYLNNKDAFAPFVYQGKPVTPRQVLGKVVTALTNEYDYDDNYTDLELSVRDLKSDSRNKSDYSWKLPKAKLYDLLKVYYPEFGKRFSLENFRAMSTEGLQELFTGENGLFRGHPKLGRAVVRAATQGNKAIVNPKESVTKGIGKVQRKDVQAAWNLVVQQANEAGIKIAEKFSEYAKLDPESMAKIFNQAKFQYVVDGEPRTILARIVNVNGKEKPYKRVDYYYEYEKVNEPTEKESASYITLSFPYGLIGDIYDFGYDTKAIFSPVDEEDVVKGTYEGMYLYKTVNPMNGRHVYAISRSIISPRSYMRTYPTLEAAKKGILERNAKDKIRDNGLISIKQNKEGVIPRTSNIEMDNINEGQILTVLDLSLPIFDFSKRLPGSFRDLLDCTVPEFQEKLGSVRNISLINTPEKAAAFTILAYSNLQRQDAQTITSDKKLETLVDLLNSPDYATVTSAIVDQIDKAGTISYYVEKVVVSKESGYRQKRKIATLKLLGNGGNTNVNVEGTHVGDVTVDDYINQTMDGAITFFKEQYGVPVNSITSSEDLESFSKEHNLGLEAKAESVKAFIYDGQIYIYTPNAKTSDLFHEISHIFLGVLKARYPEGYRQIIDDYSKKYGFKKKLNWMESSYKNFAMQDRIEEAVVDMIADEMFKDGKLSIGFNQARFTEMMQNVVNTVESFKNDMQKNNMGFDDFMQSLLKDPEVVGKMKKNRQLTNFVQQAIAKGTIIEYDC